MGALASAILWLGRTRFGLPSQWHDGRFPSPATTLPRVARDRRGLYAQRWGAARTERAAKQFWIGASSPDNYVLFLGRFSPEKGCHLLVEAFEQIETDAKLVMAGASSYCDEYSRELRGHASERIRILDWVSGETLDELLTNAMVFVLPSDLEGLSLALLDAMGAGVAC